MKSLHPRSAVVLATVLVAGAHDDAVIVVAIVAVATVATVQAVVAVAVQLLAVAVLVRLAVVVHQPPRDAFGFQM